MRFSSRVGMAFLMIGVWTFVALILDLFMPLVFAVVIAIALSRVSVLVEQKLVARKEKQISSS